MITNQFRQLMHNLSFNVYFKDTSDMLVLKNCNNVDWNMNNYFTYTNLFDTVKFPNLMSRVPNISNASDMYNGGNTANVGVIFINTPDVVITPDDYKITGSILNKKLNSSYTIKYEVDKAHTYWVVTGVYTLKNISTEAITITDVCLSNYYMIMVDHTKLDEPLTLEPNETGEITYTIKSTCQLLTTESTT